MANKNNKQKSKWSSFWVGLIVFAIIAVGLAVFVGWRTSGFKDWTFGFDKPAVTKPDDQNKDNEEPGKDPDGEEAYSISISHTKIAPDKYEEYGISPEAEKAYLLAVTFTPSDTKNKAVDWEFGWNNRASKNEIGDHVKFTVSEDTLTATAEYLQAFSEQIVARATVQGNSKVTAICELDCVAKITDVESTWVLDGFSFDRDLYLDCAPVYSAGTITPEIRLNVKDVFIDEAFVDTPFANKVYEKTGNVLGANELYKEFITKTGSIPFKYNPENQLLSFDGKTFSEVALVNGRDTFYSNCLNLCILDGCDSMFGITVEISAVYDGELISTITKTFYPKVKKDSFGILGIPVDDVNLSEDKVLFSVH